MTKILVEFDVDQKTLAATLALITGAGGKVSQKSIPSETTEDEGGDEYDGMKMSELKKLIKERKILGRISSKLTEDELREKLREADAENSDEEESEEEDDEEESESEEEESEEDDEEEEEEEDEEVGVEVGMSVKFEKKKGGKTIKHKGKVIEILADEDKVRVKSTTDKKVHKMSVEKLSL